MQSASEASVLQDLLHRRNGVQAGGQALVPLVHLRQLCGLNSGTDPSDVVAIAPENISKSRAVAVVPHARQHEVAGSLELLQELQLRGGPLVYFALARERLHLLEGPLH